MTRISSIALRMVADLIPDRVFYPTFRIATITWLYQYVTP